MKDFFNEWMKNMKKKNELTCPVVVSEDIFDEANDTLASVLRDVTGSANPRALLVADMNVVQHTPNLGTRIGKYVQTHGIALTGAPVVLGGGEKIKCDGQQSVLRVANAAIDAKVGVADCLIALGGGTVLDVAGFAATQVRGGVKLVRIPTTVAAMVDAGFSDMAAVDAARVKDAFRVPSSPEAIIVDPSFAETVLDGVWRAGFSEAVRLAAVTDASLMKKLAEWAPVYYTRDRAMMTEVVKASVALRQKKGGSTFGLWSALRLEALSGYKLPHGYSVAIGIAVDTAYAVQKGLLSEKDRALIVGSLEACGAMDGAVHSKHLLAQTDSVLFGLDSWRLSTGSEEIALCTGLGKLSYEPAPDREIMREALAVFS